MHLYDQCDHGRIRLIPPIYVKPFVKRQKNDAAGAAAIAEAAVRPNLYFVVVKRAEHQARAVAYRTHQCFVGQQTQAINALRGHLAEFGLVFPQGVPHLKEIRAVMDDESVDVPPGIREIIGLDLEHIDTLSAKIEELSLTLRECALGRTQDVVTADARERHQDTVPQRDLNLRDTETMREVIKALAGRLTEHPEPFLQ
jgi:transposase